MRYVSVALRGAPEYHQSRAPPTKLRERPPTYDGHVEEAQVALDPLRREQHGAVQLGRQGHGDAALGRVGARAGPVQARVVDLVVHVPGGVRGGGGAGQPGDGYCSQMDNSREGNDSIP